jgi:hypothetical protein
MRYYQYQQYNKQASQIEGLVFGSSRSYPITDELLQRYLPQRGKFINLAMAFGGMTDFVPMLEYILRDKAQRGEAIRNIVLLLDIDFFGKQPWTNFNIAAFLPPALSTESAGRFWWRYLTAVQMKSWNDTIRASITAHDATPAASRLPSPVVRAGLIATPLPPAIRPVLVNDANENAPKDRPAQGAAPAGAVAGVVTYARDRVASNSVRPDLDHQVELFARIVALCRDHGIHLLVITSPILRYYMDSYVPGDLQHNVDLLARFTPIWDFATQGDIADRADLWIDDSHFRRPVVEMMLSRVFAQGDSSAAKFGRLVFKTSP